MNNSQQISELIKAQAKKKNIPIKTMLSDLNMGINTISELSRGKQLSYISFSRIADYLDVSVDYLLGRTDDPDLSTKKQDAGDLQFSAKECKVIRAYRNKPEMQPAVDKLLNIYEDTNIVNVYRAAKSEESHPDEIVPMSRERLQKLKDAPETDDIL